MGKKRTFGSSFKKIDMFASDVSFRENGGDSFGSITGSVMSLAIILLVASYGFRRCVTVMHYADTNQNQFVVKKQLTQEVVGQDELQLQFGFGLFNSS